jgi:phosphocarrier protein HPr
MNLLGVPQFAAPTSSFPTRAKAVSSQMIQNRLGLHGRPAAMFVKVANKHRANVWVQKDGEQVNGKSILGLMTLAAGKGTRLVISAEGADAEKAVQELEMLIQRRFDEE